MENVLFKAGNLVIDKVYDLKGSWVDRTTDGEGSAPATPTRPLRSRHQRGNTSANGGANVNGSGAVDFRRTLKDEDMQSNIRVSHAHRAALLAQLSSDAGFLARLQLMDYSLLVGVHAGRLGFRSKSPGVGSWMLAAAGVSPPPVNPSLDLHREGVPRVPDPEDCHDLDGGAYFFGMIDLLQTWSFSKSAESFLKTKFLGKDAEGISAVKPDRYAWRFVQTMQMVIEGV